jgi:hypothetical protein
MTDSVFDLVASEQGVFILIFGAVIISVLLTASSTTPMLWIYLAAVAATGMGVTLGAAFVRADLMVLPILFIVVRRPISGPNLRATASRASGVRRTISLPAVGYFWIGCTALSSLFIAPVPSKSLWVTVQIACAVAVYALVSHRNDIKRRIVCIGTWVLGLISLVSILGFLAVEFGNIPSKNVIGVEPDGRLIGLSFEVNAFAAQSVCWLAVMFVWRRRLNRIHAALAILIGIAVILAATRAAWVALAFLIFLLIIGAMISGRRPSLYLAIPGLALLITYGLAGGIQAQNRGDIAWRLLNVFNTSEGTGAYRKDIYEVALSDTNQTVFRLLFGSGANSFSQYHVVDSTGVGAPYLSSVWIAVIYDSGVVGFVLFVAMLVACILRCKNRSNAVVVLICLLICATTTNMIWFAFFWIYLALVPVSSRYATEEEADDGSHVGHATSDSNAQNVQV